MSDIRLLKEVIKLRYQEAVKQHEEHNSGYYMGKRDTLKEIMELLK